MNRSHAIFGLMLPALLWSFSVRANDPPTIDPEVARLNAEAARISARTALLAAEAALTTARYGVPAAAPAGTIGAPEKFPAIGQWTLGIVTTQAANAVVKQLMADFSPTNPGVCASKGLLITSVEDRRAAAWTAEIVRTKLEAFSKELGRSSAGDRGGQRIAIVPAVAALSGTVSALDSLVGLVRADYTFSNVAGTHSDLSLRIELANALASAKACRAPAKEGGCAGDAWLPLVRSSLITVDGLEGPRRIRPPGESRMVLDGTRSELMKEYRRFNQVRLEAVQAYSVNLDAAKTDAEKARLAATKQLLDAAATLDTVLTTPAAGVVPLVALALAEESSGVGRCAIFVKFGDYAASMVSRKRLLSRNDSVVVVAGGIVQMALYDPEGTQVHAGTVLLDERIKARLSDIIESGQQISSQYSP